MSTEEKKSDDMTVAGRGNSGAFGLKEAARESGEKWAHSVLIE
jgi:hypothetical protein